MHFIMSWRTREEHFLTWGTSSWLVSAKRLSNRLEKERRDLLNDVFLMACAQMQINNREQLYSSNFRTISFPIHKSLNHLYDLLLEILNLYLLENMFY